MVGWSVSSSDITKLTLFSGEIDKAGFLAQMMTSVRLMKTAVKCLEEFKDRDDEGNTLDEEVEDDD